jgi:hypothetical protein
LDALVSEFVGDEPVAELRIVVVDVDRGVDQVRVVPVPPADRVGIIWEHVAGQVGSCPAEDLVLLLQLLRALAQLAVLRLEVTARAAAAVNEGPPDRPSSRSAIFSQRARQDSETPKLRATCAID